MKKKTDRSLNRKFLLLEIAAVLILVVFLVGISEKPVREDVTLEELRAPIADILEETTSWNEKGVQEFRKYYGLSAEDMEGFLIYLPASNMDASECLLVVMKDESQAEDVKKAMETRLENQKKVFESYGVDQMRLLNNAVICVKGRYGLFISSEKAEEVKKSFLAVVEGK